MHLVPQRSPGHTVQPGLLPWLLLGACGGGASGTGGPSAVPATLSFSATTGPGATPLATPPV